MNDYFAFRFHEPSDDKRKSLVIFFASKVSLEVIAKALKQDVTDHLVPKNVYVMALGNAFIKHDQCKTDSFFVNEFTSYVGDLDDHLVCLSTDGKGGLFYCDNKPVAEDLKNNILHCGMIALFKKHSGLITSSHGYHFTKPSGDHCDKFIRASNLLVSSIEVSFLALAVLPYMRGDLKRIYIDTSSIAYLVSIAIQLYGDFENGTPSIESFESYAVLKKPYDFVEDRSSLLLISATTSGSLVKKLLTLTSFSRDQIVTLFHINLPGGQLGIFDVASAIPGGIVSRKAPECNFCKLGAKLIRIAGDQFLPENPQHELRVINKTDFDKFRQKFFQQFASREVLGWNTAVRESEDSKEHFFIDVDKALSIGVSPFSLNLIKSIRRHVSRDLAVVVTFDDAGSKALEAKIRDHLGGAAESIKWLTPDSLNESEVKGAASVMVLAGAITSGRSLLAVSRKLRGIDSLATATYFVGFSKLPNEESFIQLKKDLRQGGNELVVLSHCSVPRIKEHTKTAWDWEQEALQPFGDDDPLSDATQVLPNSLAERYKSLINHIKDSDSLFLPNPRGAPLKLRRTFAFWADLNFDADRLDETVQSDVYWTVQCVLHDLRNTSENNGLAATYHTTLVSPANFDRFNDGIIQACLLRAALPVEMDYRVDPIFSRQMTDVILSIISNWGNSQGEAALEFLMALWTRRLRINDAHLIEVVALKNAAMPEAMQFLLNQFSDVSARRSKPNA